MEFLELKQLVESNAKSIEALTNESSQSLQRFEQRFTVLGNEISDLKDTVFTLAQIASYHEKRLTQLVGYSITGESDRLDFLQRLQKLERRINQLEEGDRTVD
jgi:phage shock protein A